MNAKMAKMNGWKAVNVKHCIVGKGIVSNLKELELCTIHNSAGTIRALFGPIVDPCFC